MSTVVILSLCLLIFVMGYVSFVLCARMSVSKNDWKAAEGFVGIFVSISIMAVACLMAAVVILR